LTAICTYLIRLVGLPWEQSSTAGGHVAVVIESSAGGSR